MASTILCELYAKMLSNWNKINANQAKVYVMHF